MMKCFGICVLSWLHGYLVYTSPWCSRYGHS
uniref:Uncharacterized protein n=1 Tax=Anguilla anguilla TaxID=7936 RepID=A0A0E9S0X3_ANGAN